MNHTEYENRNELSRDRKLSRNMRNALPVSKSLAIFGYTCWRELETEEQGDNLMTVKERLDIAFHSKIAEIQNQNNENFQVLMPERMSKRDKEIHNRRVIQTIESNSKIRLPKEPKNQESDICQAYQILLAEHNKRSNKKSKGNTASMKIKVKMEKLADDTDTNEGNTKDKQSDKNETRSQKSITSRKPGKNKSKSKSNSTIIVKTQDIDQSGKLNVDNKEGHVPSLAISKSKSMSDVRLSGFKGRVKQVQATAAVTQAFRSSGNQQSLQRWKQLLQ